MPIDLLPGSSIQANTITVAQMNPNTWAQVYSALSAANAAFDQANAAYSRANTANTAAAGASGGFAKSFLVGL